MYVVCPPDGDGLVLCCRKSSKPHEDILGIQSKSQKLGMNSMGLTQSKNFLMSKFSSLNQKVKQTNIGNLRKLGPFNKEVKGFLKPNLQANPWKSDSSLENPGTETKDHAESDLELSSDSDSFHSDDYIPKSDDDGLVSGSLENIGQLDYVLPSCGIIASAPRLGGRSQSVSSAEPSLHHPTEIQVTQCEASPEQKVLVDFGTPIDAYCHQFVHDAQTKDGDCAGSDGGKEQMDQVVLRNNSPRPSTEVEPEIEQLPRPSQLEVSGTDAGSRLSVDFSAASGRSSPGSGASPADSSGSRVVSPFAKIRSSVVQVANITQAGLAQGINFAVAKVQKSPEPTTVPAQLPNDFKELFTQCQTRIIQI
ncbi:PREDICTED: phosphatidylinositide phosphatase SAC2-like [Nanorana parkeri]|uniref:phosphatidylinositide phosphatase SAC2-like n=1 Tax=Nanorana parkeri TaxID=125878 RepID=UPI000854E7DD|nr:PREDICTED: phosphatidylinositide phosphatase SAC2-like [Nanorana parkeri]